MPFYIIRLEGLSDDVRIAVRGLYRRPGFVGAAVATLALGIGASTAIFSVAYGVSLRPLPYPEPERLIRIYEANPAAGKLKEDVAQGSFQGWREGATSIESLALIAKPIVRVPPGTNQRLTSISVTPSFFDVIGVRPLLGRTFNPEPQYTRFTLHEVVLSYGAWQRAFGADPTVVGRSLRIDERDDDAFRVVGVMPEGFAYTEPVDLWLPQIVELPVPRVVRTWRYDRAVARLRPGAGIDRARAELQTIAAQLARNFPASNAGWTVTVESLHQSIVGNFSRATWLLLAAVGVVLLVACVNVGGLLVARASARGRETAVRIALGAGQVRLLRLWLAEALLLSALGGGSGLLLAWSGVAALRAAAPPGIPRLDAIALDWPTLIIAAASTLFAAAVFTAAPVVAAPRRDLLNGLRAGAEGAGISRTQQAARFALTIAQCAGAATLVVLAVMLTRSFIKLMSFDLGWQPAGVLSLTISPPMPREPGRPWHRYVQWSDQLTAALASSPGIRSAAITTHIPLSPQPYPSTIARGRGRKDSETVRWPGVEHIVSDGYFDVMGIRLVSGRTFGAVDRSTEAQVNWTEKREIGTAIVSETTARTLWPDRSPLGQALWLPDIDNVAWREVIGVVKDIQFHAVGELPALHVFVPWTQMASGRPCLVVKSAAGAAAIVATVRDVAQRVHPGTEIDQVEPLDTLVARATAQPRFTSRLVSAFGALALLLSAVGIYGTLSYLVSASRREIGIRLALGASRPRIMTDVVTRGVAPALIGGVFGLGMAFALARTFRALLFEVPPLDLTSFAGGAALLLAVALTAALAPAHRAARVDPARALKVE